MVVLLNTDNFNTLLHYMIKQFLKKGCIQRSVPKGVLNKEEEPRCHPSPRERWRCRRGRQADRRRGRWRSSERRRTRTAPSPIAHWISPHGQPEPVSKTDPNRTVGRPTGHLIVHKWPSLDDLTDRYLIPSCKTPSDVDAGLPSCPLRDQFSTW